MSHKESSDSSSYEVNEDDPVEKPAPPPPAKQEACSVKGSCCCCCQCPFAKLKPENLEDTLNEHKEAVDRIQSMILFRRPIAAAALLAFVNLHFLVFYLLDLPFLAQVVFCILYRFVYKLAVPLVWPMAEGFLFAAEIERGSNEESNRMRDTKEIAEVLTKVVTPIGAAVKLVRKVATDKTLVGLATYAVVLFCALILTKLINFFWVAVILVNAVLIVPGVLLHPQVAPFVANLTGKVKKD